MMRTPLWERALDVAYAVSMFGLGALVFLEWVRLIHFVGAR